MTLQFGDIKTILWIARNTPHVAEVNGHECNCEYCNATEDSAYQCSECNSKRDTLDAYIKVGDFVKCPNCRKLLLSEEDYYLYLKSKQGYITPKTEEK